METFPSMSAVESAEIPEIQPRRLWYGISGAIGGGGVVLGIVLFASFIVYVVQATPDDISYFEKESLSWQVNAGRTQTVFLEESSKFKGSDIGRARCEAHAVNHSGKLTFRRYDRALIANDERALFDIHASRSGEYVISCQGIPHATYAIGKPIDSGTGTTMAILGYSAAAVPVVGLVAAVAMAVTVAVKRRRNRRLAER